MRPSYIPSGTLLLLFVLSAKRMSSSQLSSSRSVATERAALRRQPSRRGHLSRPSIKPPTIPTHLGGSTANFQAIHVNQGGFSASEQLQYDCRRHGVFLIQLLFTAGIGVFTATYVANSATALTCVFAGLAVVVGFALPARGVIRDCTGAVLRRHIARQLSRRSTVFGAEGDAYSRVHHSGKLSEAPSSLSVEPRRVPTLSACATSAGSAASANAAVSCTSPSGFGQIVAAATAGAPLSLPETASICAAAAAAAASAAAAAASAGDSEGAATAAAAAADAAADAAVAAAAAGSPAAAKHQLSRRILRLRGPVLHAHVEQGLISSAPAWNRFSVRQAAVHSVATGTPQGAGTLTLTRDSGGGSGDKLQLRQYWVRRANRIGTPLGLHVVLALASAAVFTGLQLAVLALKAHVARNTTGIPAIETVGAVGAALLPVFAVAGLLLRASLVRENAPFNGDGGFSMCLQCVGRPAVPEGERGDRGSSAGEEAESFSCTQQLLCPAAGRGLASFVFWRNFVFWGFVYSSLAGLTVVTSIDSALVTGEYSEDTSNAAVWLDTKPLVALGVFAFLHAAAHVALLRSVRTNGVALALVPRPGTPAAAVAARSMPRGVRLLSDGAALVFGGHWIMAAPPGTHFLLFRSAADAAIWERALAYESCNGVLGVSMRLLRVLASSEDIKERMRQTRDAAVADAKAAFKAAKKKAKGLAAAGPAPHADDASFAKALQQAQEAVKSAESKLLDCKRQQAAPITTGDISDHIMKPACIDAAKELAAERGEQAVDNPASTDTLVKVARTPSAATSQAPLPPHTAFQRSFYETFLMRRSGQRLPDDDVAEAAQLSHFIPQGLEGIGHGDFDEDVGPATAFVSHVWSSPFERLVSALDAKDTHELERSVDLHWLTLGFDAAFLSTGWLEDVPLLSERERRSWLDIFFKNQAGAGGSTTAEEATRRKELEAHLRDPKGFRWNDAQRDYPLYIARKERQQLRDYAAQTEREFKFCVSGPGVVDGVCNVMVDAPAAVAPKHTPQPGPTESTVPPPATSSPDSMARQATGPEGDTTSASDSSHGASRDGSSGSEDNSDAGDGTSEDSDYDDEADDDRDDDEGCSDGSGAGHIAVAVSDSQPLALLAPAAPASISVGASATSEGAVAIAETAAGVTGLQPASGPAAARVSTGLTTPVASAPGPAAAAALLSASRVEHVTPPGSASGADRAVPAGVAAAAPQAPLVHPTVKLPDLVTRAWTLYEAYSATLLGVTYNILEPPRSEATSTHSGHAAAASGALEASFGSQNLSSINLRQATAWNPLDFYMIGRSVKRTTGFDKVSRTVRAAFAKARTRYYEAMLMSLHRHATHRKWASRICAIVVALAVIWCSVVFAAMSDGLGKYIKPEDDRLWYALIPPVLAAVMATITLQRHGCGMVSARTNAAMDECNESWNEWNAAAAAAASEVRAGKVSESQHTAPSRHVQGAASGAASSSSSSNGSSNRRRAERNKQRRSPRDRSNADAAASSRAVAAVAGAQSAAGGASGSVAAAFAAAASTAPSMPRNGRKSVLTAAAAGCAMETAPVTRASVVAPALGGFAGRSAADGEISKANPMMIQLAALPTSADAARASRIARTSAAGTVPTRASASLANPLRAAMAVATGVPLSLSDCAAGEPDSSTATLSPFDGRGLATGPPGSLNPLRIIVTESAGGLDARGVEASPVLATSTRTSNPLTAVIAPMMASGSACEREAAAAELKATAEQ